MAAMQQRAQGRAAPATPKDKPVITTEKHAPKKNELSSEKFMENVRHLVETRKDLLMMDCPEQFDGRPFYPVVRGTPFLKRTAPPPACPALLRTFAA